MTTEDESINEIMETSDDTSGVGVSDNSFMDVD